MTATTNQPSSYTLVLGTAGTRKVHMAWSKTKQALCDRSHLVYVDVVLAELDEDGGQDGTIATLLATGIAPQHLCGRCFTPLFSSIYRAKAQNLASKGADDA